LAENQENNKTPEVQKEQKETPELTDVDINKWGTTENINKKALTQMKELAKETLEDAKRMVLLHKTSNESSNFELDFATFPKPENYNDIKKAEIIENFEKDLARWLNNETLRIASDVATQKGSVVEALEKINETIDQQALNLYLRMGYTEAFIYHCFQMAKGDLNQLARIIKQEAAKTRATVEQNTDEVIEVVKQEGGSTRQFVEEDNVKTRRLVQENKINTSINHAVTRGTVNQRAKETQEINALSSAISAAINNTDDSRAETTVQKVEVLKQSIINNSKLSHSEKIDKLENLRQLVINNDYITQAHLNKIAGEDSRWYEHLY